MLPGPARASSRWLRARPAPVVRDRCVDLLGCQRLEGEDPGAVTLLVDLPILDQTGEVLLGSRSRRTDSAVLSEAGVAHGDDAVLVEKINEQGEQARAN